MVECKNVAERMAMEHEVLYQLSQNVDKRQIYNDAPGDGYKCLVDGKLTLYVLWFEKFLKPDMRPNDVDYGDKSLLRKSLCGNARRPDYNDIGVPKLQQRPSVATVIKLLGVTYNEKKKKLLVKDAVQCGQCGRY